MNKTNAQKKIDFFKIFQKYIATIVVLVLFIVSATLSKSFLSAQNISNLFRQLAMPTLVSMGMLFVILTGGIDLSVGSVVALTSCVFIKLIETTNGGFGFPLFPSILLMLLIAGMFGAFQGYLVADRKLAPFVVTLAGMTIARGIALIVSSARPTILTNDVLKKFAINDFIKIPQVTWLVILVVVALALIQRFTPFGRFVQAVGSNETAVKLSGVNTNKYIISVYVMSAVLAAVAGIISVSRAQIGSPGVGEGFELDAIAAVVIGGARLNGGKGTVLNTIMGVLALGMINNIMNLLNIQAYSQSVLKGIIILLAVLLQTDYKKTKDISSI